MQNQIKIFILEEHHEAYFVWKYALKNNLIEKLPYTLLHIDEHSDMSSPTLNVPLETLNGNLRQVMDFTYRELNIASFIVPAVYEGIFNDVIWVRYKHNKTVRKAKKLYVRSDMDKGQQLITGQTNVLDQFPDREKKLRRKITPFRFYKHHWNDIQRLKNVVLDIDLDYFSCIQDPLRKELQIEITKEEFDRYTNNNYHRIKFYDFGRTEVFSKKGKYYYCLNKFRHGYKSPLKVSRQTINHRINNLVSVLRDQIVPPIITICRSRFSGYTPSDQWEHIEKQLLKGLEACYPIDSIFHISEIVPH